MWYQSACRFWTPNRGAYGYMGQMYVDDERSRANYEKMPTAWPSTSGTQWSSTRTSSSASSPRPGSPGIPDDAASPPRSVRERSRCVGNRAGTNGEAGDIRIHVMPRPAKSQLGPYCQGAQQNRQLRPGTLSPSADFFLLAVPSLVVRG
ncbi:TipAS antibiotic-recognition domain-containing protein [Rhodococcus sp. RD6.2]|uniref:TipAS antibiotic-recognition domain-containing protein n=1 Tax=Rhodococcus sp. RD6.2 TaxID=260936 RepID=UPI001C120620